MSDADGPGIGRGKWGREGVPKKGWHCVNVEDLGEPSAVCEMCEATKIRYVQYMRNNRYTDELACGQICAAHMSEDFLGAERRDKRMRSTARRRQSFPKKKSWYIKPNGNLQIKEGRFIVTVFRTPAGLWKGVVNDRTRKLDGVFTRDRFPTPDEAKLAAFDTLQFIQDY